MTSLAALIGFCIANVPCSLYAASLLAKIKFSSGGDLTRRVAEQPAKDELGEMTHTLNRMLDSLEESFQRERQFTSGPSHELRTPVAVILACGEGLKADVQ